MGLPSIPHFPRIIDFEVTDEEAYPPRVEYSEGFPGSLCPYFCGGAGESRQPIVAWYSNCHRRQHLCRSAAIPWIPRDLVAI